MDLTLGSVIRGKYRIDRILGKGGMGVVVGAQHLALDQRVAIKFLLPAMLEHPVVVERFAREARAASRIQSDHVARVMDVDALEDGTPFMVMEYLEGSDLSSVRKTGQPLPAHVAVGYLLEACEAVGEAHRAGIVHRDLKPANLFLSKREGGRTRVKVLDFGISKIGAAGGEVSVTQTASVVGSAEYMSPEQMASARDADARSDIWALGVTLYELLTARVPFPGDSITAVCALVLQSQPAVPSMVRQDLPPGLDRVVMTCLEKDRTRRFSSVEQLAAALAPYASPSAGAAGYNVAPFPQAAPNPYDRASNPAMQPAIPGAPPSAPGSTGGFGAQQGYRPPQPSASGYGPASAGSFAQQLAADVQSPVSRSSGGTQAVFTTAPVQPVATPSPSRAPIVIGAVLLGAVLCAGGVAIGVRHASPAHEGAAGTPTSAVTATATDTPKPTASAASAPAPTATADVSATAAAPTASASSGLAAEASSNPPAVAPIPAAPQVPHFVPPAVPIKPPQNPSQHTIE